MPMLSFFHRFLLQPTRPSSKVGFTIEGSLLPIENYLYKALLSRLC